MVMGETAENVAAQFGIPRAYDDWRELVAALGQGAA